MCRVGWSLRKVNMISARLSSAEQAVVRTQCPVSVITLCNFAPGSLARPAQRRPGPGESHILSRSLNIAHFIMDIQIHSKCQDSIETLVLYSDSLSPDSPNFENDLEGLRNWYLSLSRGCVISLAAYFQVSGSEWPVCPELGLLPGLHTRADCSPALSPAPASSVTRSSWAEKDLLFDSYFCLSTLTYFFRGQWPRPARSDEIIVTREVTFEDDILRTFIFYWNNFKTCWWKSLKVIRNIDVQSVILQFKSRSWCEFGIFHFLLASDESPGKVRHRQWVTGSVISTLGHNPPHLTRNKWLVMIGDAEENISGVKMVNRRVTSRIVCLWMNNIHMYEHNHSATTTPLLPRDRPLRNLLLLAFNPDSCKKILRTW